MIKAFGFKSAKPYFDNVSEVITDSVVYPIFIYVHILSSFDSCDHFDSCFVFIECPLLCSFVFVFSLFISSFLAYISEHFCASFSKSAAFMTIPIKKQ